MEGAWVQKMVRQMTRLDATDDFVIGTGKAHAVRDFLHEAFGNAGLDWRGYVCMERL